jgi:DNA repair exonuclease SbcCD ATPase subunit
MAVKEVFSHPWIKRYDRLDDTILNQSVTDKLFDIVIERIQKKKKLNTTKIKKNEQIVIKLEKKQTKEIKEEKEEIKCETKADKEEAIEQRYSSIKDHLGEESQSMLKEIQEIGKQLDDYNKRVKKVKKQTTRLKTKFEKSSTMDFTNKLEHDPIELFSSRDSLVMKKKKHEDAINEIFSKSECSTQTDAERPKTVWGNFLKLFQCSN